jgi:hypothetical protein
MYSRGREGVSLLRNELHPALALRLSMSNLRKIERVIVRRDKETCRIAPRWRGYDRHGPSLATQSSAPLYAG